MTLPKTTINDDKAKKFKNLMQKCMKKGIDKSLTSKVQATLYQLIPLFGEVLAYTFESQKKYIPFEDLRVGDVEEHLKKKWETHMCVAYENLPTEFQPKHFEQTKKGENNINIVFMDNAHAALNELIPNFMKHKDKFNNLKNPDLQQCPISVIALQTMVIDFFRKWGWLTTKYENVLDAITNNNWFDAIRLWCRNIMTKEYNAICASYLPLPTLELAQQYQVQVLSNLPSYQHILQALVNFYCTLLYIVYIIYFLYIKSD